MERKIRIIGITLLIGLLAPIVWRMVDEHGYEARRQMTIEHRLPLRVLQSALDAYVAQHGQFPQPSVGPDSPYGLPPELAEKIAQDFPDMNLERVRYWLTETSEPTEPSVWFIWGPGPDGVYQIDEELLHQAVAQERFSIHPGLRDATYDPRNGIHSPGDVWSTNRKFSLLQNP